MISDAAATTIQNAGWVKMSSMAVVYQLVTLILQILL